MSLTPAQTTQPTTSAPTTMTTEDPAGAPSLTLPAADAASLSSSAPSVADGHGIVDPEGDDAAPADAQHPPGAQQPPAGEGQEDARLGDVYAVAVTALRGTALDLCT